MTREGAATAIGVFVTAFVASLIVMNYPDEGPVVATFSTTHGLHLGDLLLLLGWLVTMCLLVALVRAPWRRR